MHNEHNPSDTSRRLDKHTIYVRIGEHVSLFDETTCLLVWQEDMAFLVTWETCPLAKQEDRSACLTRRHVFLLDQETCLLTAPEDMSSSSARRHLRLSCKQTCLLVKQEDRSSGWTRKHVFWFGQETWHCFVAEQEQQEDMPSCSTRRHVLLHAHALCVYLILPLYLKDCFRYAPDILVVCDGIESINLGGLQAALKGGLGEGSPHQKQIN